MLLLANSVLANSIMATFLATNTISHAGLTSLSRYLLMSADVSLGSANVRSVNVTMLVHDKDNGYVSAGRV